MTPLLDGANPDALSQRQWQSSRRAILPAWSVYAWPALVCRAEPVSDWHLLHLSTCVLTSGDACQACSGQTLWSSELETGAAALAWDWVCLGEGVVALADPFGLITNLHLVDDYGLPLPTMQVALHLNQLVHKLPWQREVHRAMHDAVMT